MNEADLNDKVARLERELGELSTDVRNGWEIIRENKTKCETLTTQLTKNDERTQQMFDLLKEISQSVKEVNKSVSSLEKFKTEIDVKTKMISLILNPKVILAFAAGVAFVISALKIQ